MAESAGFVDTRTPDAARRARRMTIVAQDPSVRDEAGRIVVAQVDVPADLLEPGPRGQRFHVVDYDAARGVLRPPVDLRDAAAAPEQHPWSYLDRFVGVDDARLVTDFDFHAQNVYAIAARTLAAFEQALGRRLAWAFPGHQLYLVPHAFSEANAHYAGDDRGVFFGYLELADETIYTCLSHDIVAHEVTHAVLDGLRPHLIEPGLPDQAAFHEAFADIVALLSVFSVGGLVETVLGRADARGRIPAARVERLQLERTALTSLAEQFGEATSGVRGSALRRSLELPERRLAPRPRLRRAAPSRGGRGRGGHARPDLDVGAAPRGADPRRRPRPGPRGRGGREGGEASPADDDPGHRLRAGGRAGVRGRRRCPAGRGRGGGARRPAPLPGLGRLGVRGVRDRPAGPDRRPDRAAAPLRRLELRRAALRRRRGLQVRLAERRPARDRPPLFPARRVRAAVGPRGARRARRQRGGRRLRADAERHRRRGRASSASSSRPISPGRRSSSSGEGGR